MDDKYSAWLARSMVHVARYEAELKLAQDRLSALELELVEAKQDVENKTQALETAKAKCKALGRIIDGSSS